MKTIDISKLRPQDETEDLNLAMDDEFVANADCYFRPDFEGRRSDVLLKFDAAGKPLDVEIWLDPGTGKWRSRTNVNGCRLSPDQMGRFFETEYFRGIRERLSKDWKDNKLLEAVKKAEIDMSAEEEVSEDGEFRKGNVDKEKSREKNAAGRQERTNSGRKIVTFSQFGLNQKDDNRYYCWPERGKEYKWSQWADWKKIVPLARMRFHHNQYTYGLSISPSLDTSGNRGWRGYNLDIEPKLQWLTTIEVAQCIELRPIQKFIQFCENRIKSFLAVDDEEILEKVNNPEHCQIEDIKKTKSILRKSLDNFERADTFMYE